MTAITLPVGGSLASMRAGISRKQLLSTLAWIAIVALAVALAQRVSLPATGITFGVSPYSIGL